MTTLYVLIAVAIIALAFYLKLKLAINRSVDKVKRPPGEIEEGKVQCFSCGMVVAKEKALEKKGRYFCGVKRNDRNGVPITDDRSVRK
jgi:NADH:ubiquinone oxidoreductase subunit 3 (subunit A)